MSEGWAAGLGSATRWRPCGSIAVWLLVQSAAPWALAQEAAEPTQAKADAQPFQPGSWQWGEEPRWRLTPGLSLFVGRNDNLRLSPTQPLRSTFTTWLPGLVLQAPPSEERTFSVSLQGELTRQHQSEVDSVNNGELAVEGAHLLGPQTALAWKLGAQDWHDIVAAPLPGEEATPADHFRAMAAGAVLRRDWGDTGTWRSEVELSRSSKRYLNHRDRTQLADVHSEQMLIRSLRTLLPRMRAGLEWREGRARFPAHLLGLDNRDQRWQAVLLWEPETPGAEAQTGAPAEDAVPAPVAKPASGDFNAALRWGVQRKIYLSDPAPDPADALPAPAPWQGKTWSLEFNGALSTRQQFSLGLGREASDAPADGVDHLLQTRVQLAWSLAWSSTSRWTLSGSRAQGLYEGGIWPRQDHTRSLDLSARHDLNRQCQLGWQFGWTRRHSSQPSNEFVRRILQLSLTLAL